MLTINNVYKGNWTTDAGSDGHGLHDARLTGILDEHTVSQLRKLSETVFDGAVFSDGDHFLIDITRVTEIDHVGLATLIGIITSLAANAGSVGLVVPMEHPVQRALKVTGLDRVFITHETVEAANGIIAA